MDVLSVEVSENGKLFGGRKYSPNAVKDVKRKLSFMNKKISDLQHQRRFAYKNSVKVKKMVHNQVNQIVKCLRARERSLWCDVDEAYLSQDSTISDELSKLQSVHARCQVLFNHLDDFRGNRNILSKICSLLDQANFEKPVVKPLEFISDFEGMKNNANNYGSLHGDFLEKGDFLFVADKKDSSSSGAAGMQFLEKEERCDETIVVPHIDYGASYNYLDKYSVCKEGDIEDSFQIIDLLDNMCCYDVNEDSIMDEDDQNCNQQREKEFNGRPCEISKSDRGFNPEEEWKQIVEMNKKIADFKEMLKPHEEKKMNFKVHNDVSEYMDTKDHVKCNQNRFLLLKEADNWLCNVSSNTEKKWESANQTLESPAELVQKAFKPYFTKECAKSWLSSE